jgi:hypothetical protein
LGMGFAVNAVSSPLTPLQFATVFACVSVKGNAEGLFIEPSATSAGEIECKKERRREEKEYDQSLSPVTSKPASRGRIKTSHSEVLNSYQDS